MLFKMLFIMISFLSSSILPYEENSMSFDKEVDNAYQCYITHINYDNSYYSLKVIKGITNGKSSYGLMFYTINPKEYTMTLEIDGKNYEAKQNARGDSSIIALDIRDLKSVRICILNSEMKEVIPPSNVLVKLTLNDFDEEAFIEENTNPNIGQNIGTKYDKLYLYDTFVWKTVIIFIFVIILITCTIVIAVFAFAKKGMFSKANRKEGVFDFKAFVDNMNISQEENSKDETVYFDGMVTDEVIEEKEKKNVYQKNARYDFDDEDSIIDIPKHLQDLGFVSDYNLASEDEKKQIMLELMKLRDNNKITNDDYLKETYKLWKK